MELRDALFKAVDRAELTGKQLSEKSGVSEAQISRFRKGGDISFKNFQKLIDGLTRQAYHQFVCQLLIEQMNNQELADLIMVAVSQLSQSKENEPKRLLVSNGLTNN